MPRKTRVYKKNWKPDPQYNSLIVGRFISIIMKKGKRSVAQKIVYDTFDIIHKRTKRGGLNVFEQAIKNVSPLMQLKSRRIGGANYQIPVQVRSDRRFVLGAKWIIEVARKKKGQSMIKKLSSELCYKISI